jgi:hypothetical protein
MKGAIVSAAAVVAVAGMLVMHGIPLPGVAAVHLGMAMDRPAEQPHSPAMTEHASISAGIMAGPHNCVPGVPRTLRVVFPPAIAVPPLDHAVLGSVLHPTGPATAALARASPSLDRLCVSRR